jgi:hypothetical protein
LTKTASFPIIPKKEEVVELNSDIEQKVITNCKDMNGWIKFLGITAIIGGGLYAISIIGLIIAWLPIWMGVILLKVANGSREIADGKAESIGDMFASLKTFFILSGVLTIISIVFSVIWMLVMGIAMIGGIMGEAGGFY